VISVIIPALNRPEKLRRAVNSALAQADVEGQQIEIVIVDDGSTPPIRWEDGNPGVRIVRLATNVGPAGARNAGIRASTGEYLAFLDSDDIWLSDKLRLQFAALEEARRRQPGALVAMACAFHCPDRRTGRLQERLPKSAHDILDFASGCWFAPGSTLFLHRTAFDRVGMMDEDLRRLEDLDWFIRFGSLGGRLHVVPGSGAVIAPSFSADFDTVRTSSRRISARYGAQGPDALPPQAWRRLQAYLALEQGAALLLTRDYARAASYLLRSLFLKPRLQGAVEPFWQKRDTVAPEVLQAYEAMARNAT
jgi:glycosyltransferase involved in cell wall biosynthesis